MDDTIIDVTGQSFALPTDNEQNLSNVPYWRHQLVHSYSEINNATNEQRRFYKTFKANFLNEIYMNLDWNNNYAFILLFDFLQEYDSNGDINRLEKLLKTLISHYPKTKNNALGFLIQKFRAKGDHSSVNRICKEENYQEKSNDDTGKLGFKYKESLNLTMDQVALLDRLWNPGNNFFNIEFCSVEIVKLYLLAIQRLDDKYRDEASSLDNEMQKIADVIATKHYRHRKNSANYTYSVKSILDELYFNIFKHSENAVREHYGHKRKLNTELIYNVNEIDKSYNEMILVRLQKALAIYAPTLALPDRDTELELNAQNPARWKIKYEELTAAYNNDPKMFVSDIVILGNINKRNTAVENIFYEASKFIAPHDKEASLKLYIYYLHHDLRSVKFENKPLAKTMQKNLFKNNEQLHDFQIIVSNLINDRDLDKALSAVPQLYKVKRKKIELDHTTIQQVHEKHSGTVELLNEYLKDEYEDEVNSFKIEEINESEIVMEIAPKIISEGNNTAVLVDLNTVQLELLELFYKGNLSVEYEELEAFSKSRGMFRNQLIDSINEACYEILDDVLIEEEDEYYTINDNYYQKIVTP
ncbi:tellurite resistance TerB C-terminal domain-containing protein [Flavobacterium cerinum]|uniref:TerB-C domain-containing protein n=1 Tax=Flavobacterium cerinum TaxID=2502784 RepID=A0ABY5IPD0_9FLAO|nr:tellurite resistance TerB C-terminal domain-containing protein [Flavobacterium cerinum]UUC44693.1 hypothetical protein NOX80_13765 [Flavobacterium cerinum]